MVAVRPSCLSTQSHAACPAPRSSRRGATRLPANVDARTPAALQAAPTPMFASASFSGRRHSAVIAAASEGDSGEITMNVSSSEAVDLAFASCQRAWESGVKRQRVEMVLPLIGATDIDDWPGGIRQQFKAARPMVEALLRQLKQVPGLEGRLSAELLDEADAIGAWTSDNLALVLFPSADTLPALRRLAEARPNGLTLMVNPQWTDQGQVVSDFGIFPWQRKAAEATVATFENAFVAQEVRINGDYVQWNYAYPQGWSVYVMTGPRERRAVVKSSAERPSYQDIEAKLRKLPWTMSSKGLAERIMLEAEFNRRSVQNPPPRE